LGCSHVKGSPFSQKQFGDQYVTLLITQELRISFATGTLLGAAFLGMLPKAMAKAEPSTVLSFVLLGIILFFILEKLLIWYHCHDEKCEIHSAAPYLILLGDAFRNFMDREPISLQSDMDAVGRGEAVHETSTD